MANVKSIKVKTCPSNRIERTDEPQSDRTHLPYREMKKVECPEYVKKV